MKKTPIQKTLWLALGVALLGSASLVQAQTADTVVSSFDSGTPGVAPSYTGIWYGSSVFAYDDTQDNTGNGGGSLYYSVTLGSSSDTPMTDWICFPGNNLWWNGNTNVPLSQYKSVQFDIKWDNSSSLNIGQFNNLSTWVDPMIYSWASGLINGSINGLEICVAGLGSPGTVIATTNIPTAASNGWVHMTIPINPLLSGIDGAGGIYFHKWIQNNWAIQNNQTANFWVDNVMFEGTALPPPPPTVLAPVKPQSGLNVFVNPTGLYDRQSAELVQSNGLSWVSMATPANPVSYSFTISGFPSDAATAYGIAAQMFLCPNPAANDNAPDWNETNIVVVSVQRTANAALMTFQYKVGLPSGNNMFYGNAPYTNAPGSWDGVTPNYYESGKLGAVTNSTALGTWTVRFTSATNVTLIAPSGDTNAFVLPPYNASVFAEVNPKAFMVYLGAQANNSASQNKAVVYSSFSITGTASPFSENFLTNTVLDTTNTWITTVSTDPKGVMVPPANAAYWVPWTAPATGYQLQDASSLTGTWNMLTNTVLNLAGGKMQLVSTNELPGGSATFFRLVK